MRFWAVAFLACLLAGCSQKGAGFDGQVTVRDDAFAPTNAQVEAGEVVLFDVAVEAQRAHTVTIAMQGDDRILLDGPVQAGDQTQYSFPEAGTYDVWCRFHGGRGTGMAMTITAR